MLRQGPLDPVVVVQKLTEPAEHHSGIDRLLEIHSRTAPEFIGLVRQHIARTR